MSTNAATASDNISAENSSMQNTSFWTIQRKLLAALSICLLISFPAVILTGLIFKNAFVKKNMQETNITTTDLIAGQIGGALKFKKLDAIATSYADLVDPLNENTAAVYAFDLNTTLLTSEIKSGFQQADMSILEDLASKAISEDKTQVSFNNNLQIIAAPGRFGKNNSVVGAIVVVWSFTAVEEELNAIGLQQTLLATALLIVLLVIIYVITGRLVANPINLMTDAMSNLAAGDLSVEIPATQNKDEMGKMAQSVQIFKENAERVDRLRHEREETDARNREEAQNRMDSLAAQFEATVGEFVRNVDNSSSQLMKNAEILSSTSSDTNQQSSMADTASQQASQGVETVAAATEELSASIQEISHQVQEASSNIRNTVDITDKTSTTVEGLADEATKIGEVVTLIQDIAEQTNLLALNATIEAARAGEAGKGFAVVANEVKSLANQTAKATDDISRQVSSIQGIAKDTVKAIGEISSAVEGINSISSSIASAVEEQTAATGEISRNINETTMSIGEVSRNIQNVSDATNQSETASHDVSNAAGNLSNQTAELSGAVSSFLEDIRSR